MAKGEEDPAKLWYLGLRIGCVLVLVVWFGWNCIIDPGKGATLWNDPAIYLYSFIGAHTSYIVTYYIFIVYR